MIKTWRMLTIPAVIRQLQKIMTLQDDNPYRDDNGNNGDDNDDNDDDDIDNDGNDNGNDNTADKVINKRNDIVELIDAILTRSNIPIGEQNKVYSFFTVWVLFFLFYLF
jgi:hypothetical protein